jgi:hypothetical protein
MQKNIQKYRRRKIYTKTLAYPKTLAPSKSLVNAKNLAHPKSLADAKNLVHPKSFNSIQFNSTNSYWVFFRQQSGVSSSVITIPIVGFFMATLLPPGASFC